MVFDKFRSTLPANPQHNRQPDNDITSVTTSSSTPSAPNNATYRIRQIAMQQDRFIAVSKQLLAAINNPRKKNMKKMDGTVECKYSAHIAHGNKEQTDSAAQTKQGQPIVFQYSPIHFQQGKVKQDNCHEPHLLQRALEWPNKGTGQRISTIR